VHSHFFFLEEHAVEILKFFFVLGLKILKSSYEENDLIVIVFGDALIVIHKYSNHRVEKSISNLVDQFRGELFVLAFAMCPRSSLYLIMQVYIYANKRIASLHFWCIGVVSRSDDPFKLLD
jgi:hypothetical protein